MSKQNSAKKVPISKPSFSHYKITAAYETLCSDTRHQKWPCLNFQDFHEISDFLKNKKPAKMKYNSLKASVGGNA